MPVAIGKGYMPSLRNQHYQYLANQLHRMANGHRHNIDQSLVLFMRSFDDTDVAAVADYLSRLQEPARAHERMLSNGVAVD
jgi:cytochrome c553